MEDSKLKPELADVSDLLMEELSEGSGLPYEVLENLPIGIQILDPVIEGDCVRDARFVYVNRMCEHVLGIRRDDVLGHGTVELFPFTEDSLLPHWSEVALQRKQITFEQFFPAAESLRGVDRFYRAHASPYGDYILVAFENVTQQKQLELLLRERAERDGLTGIFNRYHFEVTATRAIALAKRENWRVGMLFMDLDDFKSVNDTFGHAAGDVVLTEFAHRVRTFVRTEDIFFRISGDEFGLFLTNTSVADANNVAARIRDGFNRRVEFDGGTHEIEFSVGVHVEDASAATVDNMMKMSDQAMYIEKRSKK